MDCTPKAHEWAAPELSIPDPALKKANFCSLTAGGIVVDEGARKTLSSILLAGGELLPLRYGDENYYLLNVTECADALDHDKTEWVVDSESGAKVDVQRYVFLTDRLPKSSIFKIPERKATLMVIEGRYPREEEFKGMVEMHGLTGIRFEKLWESG
jgi:hypothetical protein